MGVRYCSQYTLTRLQLYTTVSLNDGHFGEHSEHKYGYMSCLRLMFSLSVMGYEAMQLSEHNVPRTAECK